MNLHDYDTVIINSSGGKDSLVAMFYVCELAKRQNYSLQNIVISYQDLGKAAWNYTKELVEKQALLYNLKVYYSRRIDKNKKVETFLEYVKRRRMWPSNKQRWCTSDYKRGPGMKIVTSLTAGKTCKVLYVFGFRKDESPARAKKQTLILNQNLTTKKRIVHDWLPIHKLSTDAVWFIIRRYSLPYHYAYDLGMPRLSCVFCIFSPFAALVVAGKANPKLLDEYVQVEKEIGHSFRQDLSLASVKEAIENGQEVKQIDNWIM